MRRHPAMWPTVAAAAGVGALLALGSWQVHRLHWKDALIAARAASLAAPPLALDRLAGAELAPFRRVRLRGRFDHDREMHLLARVHRGRAGVEVVTPLRLGDGGYVLVNRGWAPSGRADPRASPPDRMPGEVEVAGILRRPGRANRWVPDNRPDRGVWHYVDPAAMAKSAGLAAVGPFVVEAGPAPNPGGYPIGGRTRTRLPNDHLQYALTWYALAVGLAAVYALYLRRLRGGG